jgi:hypothetical protein
MSMGQETGQAVEKSVLGGSVLGAGEGGNTCGDPGWGYQTNAHLIRRQRFTVKFALGNHFTAHYMSLQPFQGTCNYFTALHS